MSVLNIVFPIPADFSLYAHMKFENVSMSNRIVLKSPFHVRSNRWSAQMRSNDSLHLIGHRSELMCLGPKFLQHEHSVMTALLSLSIPSQNHLSHSFSLVWSHPKWPFSSWVFAASSTHFVFGMHSTHVALSVAFMHVYHSLPSSMVKFIAQCLARRLVWMSGMS